MSNNPKKDTSIRSDLIRNVQTPLGFFVLVVLVVEAILGVVAGFSDSSNQTIALVGMLVIIGVLVLIVSFLAFKRPEALSGSRPSIRDTPASKTNQETAEETISTLDTRPSELIKIADKYRSIKKNDYGTIECVVVREGEE